ncbi:hypothetical protein DSO57_1024389 [Entomophthora muscae]|uniref:Uncharacterized protein n=2 Tax=Entomophthora muscae TaxID=34485 RepID=A0ACC2RHH1_9FUNG|nr:hypothetical protein DSO57_1023637 [Entomophthora muscae]KAJ9076625.1 hypothetical protein DSO57_1024389 [Entomophthora muscae]
MKLLTQDQLDDANNVFLVNGAKGALGCFALSAAAVTLLPRYTRFGKTLTIPLKAFFISSCIEFYLINLIVLSIDCGLRYPR